VVPYFTDYVKTYTDLPFLVTLREREDGYVPDRFLTAADLGHGAGDSAHQTVLLDAVTGEPALPNGTLASRYSEAGKGRWNLDLGGVDPVLTLHGRHEAAVAVDLPRFDVGATEGGAVIRRGVPVVRLGGRQVTTVFDLLLAQYAVARDSLATVRSTAESSSASRLWDESGTTSRSPWRPAQEFWPADSRTRPARTCTLASPGFSCSPRTAPLTRAMTVWRSTFSWPPMIVAAARPALPPWARSSSSRAIACRENFCMSPRSVLHWLTRSQDIQPAPRNFGQLPQSAP
jgi:nitrate reductase alpha subunit